MKDWKDILYEKLPKEPLASIFIDKEDEEEKKHTN